MQHTQFPHHAASIDKLIRLFQNTDGVIAVVLGGSVAKGTARHESDVDAIVVVTDEKHRALKSENRLAECLSECTYEGGYFDIKYCTKDYLASVAHKGSEPARNAFFKARCLFTHDAEIPSLVTRIPVYPAHEKADKMLSFYSAFELNNGYLWSVSGDNLYLRVRAAADVVLFGLRLVLAEREVLFPCQRRLCDTVAALGPEHRELVAKAEMFLKQLDDESKTAFTTALFALCHYPAPADFAVTLTRFVEDWELWWHTQRPLVMEW